MILPAAIVICIAICLAAWRIGKRIDGVEARLNRCLDGLDKSLDNLAAALCYLKQTLAPLTAEAAAHQFIRKEKEKQ